MFSFWKNDYGVPMLKKQELIWVGLDKTGLSSLYPRLQLHSKHRDPTFDVIQKVESMVCAYRGLRAFGNTLRIGEWSKNPMRRDSAHPGHAVPQQMCRHQFLDSLCVILQESFEPDMG